MTSLLPLTSNGTLLPRVVGHEASTNAIPLQTRVSGLKTTGHIGMMEKLDLKAHFEGLAAQFELLRKKEENRHRAVSTFRLLSILLGAASFFLLYTSHPWLAGACAVGFLSLFIFLIKRHRAIAERRDLNLHLREVNERELDLLAHRPTSEGGLEYADPSHPYASDIDLFGNNGLFSHIDRTGWQLGRNMLATWLMSPAERAEVLQRQEAVTELSPAIDWRQRLEAMARQHNAGATGHKEIVIFKIPLIIKLTAGVFFLITLGIVAGILFWGIPLSLILLALLLNGGINTIAHFRAKESLQALENGAAHFGALHSLAKHIEGKEWKSERLQSLTAQFLPDGRPVSVLLAKAKNQMDNLEMRSNPFFYMVANGLFFWDVLWVSKLADWLQTYGHRQPNWEQAHAELEALSSLAGLRFQNPDWVMPDLTNEMVLKAESLGHMLLPKDRRVTNDVQLDGRGEVMLITGSNMAGKSTYERAVATNVVLALAGSAVCANSMLVGPIQVFTCMRVQDALTEGASSFYAELQRISQLLRLTEEGRPVLFFLDEILKGTNSADRHAGAKALIRQLGQRKCMGMVSTHDLELGQMEGEEEVSVHNFSLESTIHKGQISFDYKLRPGVCHSFNAVQLMANMGISIPAELLKE